MLQVTVSVPVSGVTQMRLYERGASGAGVIIWTGMPAGGGVITAKSRYAANANVSVAASLSTSDGWSAVSGYTNIAPFTVAAPNLLSATRVSETVVELPLTGLIPGAIGRIYRAAPGKPPAPIGDPWTIVGSTLTAAAPAPDGNAKYVYAVLQTHHGIASPLSATRQVDEWWQKPPAVSLGTPSRSTSTGNVTIPISHPTYTPRNQPTGLRVFRARKGGAKPASAYRTVTGRPTSWSDTSTTLAHDYDYWIETYGPAGPSSSAPRVSVDAVRERPNAASGATLTPLGDGLWQLEWSINATTVRPITTQDVLGRVPGQTATVVLATVAGGTTSTILTAPPNVVYEVAVRTRNAVGQAEATSNWASVRMVGTPRNVGQLAGSWSDPSTLLVTWVPTGPSIATQVEIEFSNEAIPNRGNPAHWYPVGTVPFGNFQTTLSGSSLVPHTFRARSVHVDSGITSDWIYSARVAPQAAPHAPTMEMPVTVDATGAITLRMQHNPVDGTAQKLGQIRWRRAGLPSWTTRTVGTGTSYTIAANTFTNGQSLEVQGRTAGATGVHGDWGHITAGASLLVPLRAKPTVAITSPTAGVYESQTMRIEWTASEQATASLELWDDTGGDLTLLGTATVGPDVREYVWSDVVLRDGRDIIAEVLVHDGWQAAETQTVTVTVSYNLPAPPLLRAEPGPDASVMLFATPRQGLRTTRTNMWTVPPPVWGAEGVTAADGREWWRVTAPVNFQGLGGTGYVDHLSMDVASEQGVTAQLVASGGITVDAQGAPPLPSSVRLGGDLPSGATVASVTAAGVQTIYLSRLMHVRWTGTAPANTHYFDGDTVDPDGQYAYGWNPDGTAWEAIPDPAGDRAVAPTERITIWCSRDGETWDECGETLTDWSFHDRHPAIGVPLAYKARAHAASGAWADSPVVWHTVDTCDAHLAWGEGWEHSAHAGWEPSYSGTGGRSHSLRRHIGPDGEYRITVIHGPKQERETTATLTIRTADGDTPLARWEEAAETRGLVIYRPPTGRVYVGPLQGFSWDDSREEAQHVIFTVTHTAGGTP